MALTFICENCKREWPNDRMKEVFANDRKQQLCPECLDQRMNEADRVVGVTGDEKSRAAAIDSDGAELKELKEEGRQVFGERRAG